jgi:hypothetical protein
MIEEYTLLKNKRQKLKERKKKAQQRKAEADPARLILPGDHEQQRVEALRHVKPSPEDVDCAVKGHPSAHPLLLRLLAVYADVINAVCGEDPPPFLPPLVRRQFLSPSPFTLQAIITATYMDESGLSSLPAMPSE